MKALLHFLARWLLRAALAWLLLSLTLVIPMRWFDPPGSAFMAQDRWLHGRVIEWTWVPSEQISSALKLAAIAAEDQNFPHHRGFDQGEILSALEAHREGRRLRGASTISQQLARNLYLWPQRGWLRKGLEAWFTLLLELSLPKHRILEIYLNLVEFGEGLYGAEAAAQAFYGRPAARLDAAQSALMVTVLPAPSQRDPRAPSAAMLERQRWILGQMDNLGPGWVPEG
jgi:monofunctional glycosyltransferase